MTSLESFLYKNDTTIFLSSIKISSNDPQVLHNTLIRKLKQSIITINNRQLHQSLRQFHDIIPKNLLQFCFLLLSRKQWWDSL